MGGSALVFVGRVLADSGEGWGNGPARVAIEERLLNVPKDLREVEIDVSAGTSCYYHLKAGERYVVFARRRDETKQDKLFIGACSNTFKVQGNEHILDALRNKSEGGASRLVGTVRRSSGAYSHEGGVAGATVIAESALGRYRAISDGFGTYEILGLAPNRYRIEVLKTGFVPDSEYNSRWSGRLVLNKTTNTIEPEKSDRGTVLVGQNSCEIWDLAMWPNGQISGIVHGTQREALSGVTVQAFSFDRKGKRESSPLRTATTDSQGRYVIGPLPSGEYVVGVNAQTYRDEDPYPPTVFPTEGPSRRTPIQIADGDQVDGVNLVLPPKRIGTTLRVNVAGLRGEPYSGATISLENLDGVQRWYSSGKVSPDGFMDVPVYLGEKYIVNASAHQTVDKSEGQYDYLGGSARIDVTERSPSVSIVLAPRHF